jgi:hypothetical protein
MMERDQFKKEIGDSLESLTHQYKSSLEFTDELRLYIKEYLENDVTEKENYVKVRVNQEVTKVTETYDKIVAQLKEEIKELNAVNDQLRVEAEQ